MQQRIRILSPEDALRERILLLILDMVKDVSAEINATEPANSLDEYRLHYLQGQVDGLKWCFNQLGKEVSI